MHVGFIPLNLEKRITSLQEQQRQAAGQGPIGELGGRDSLGTCPETPLRRAWLCLLPWGLLTAASWGDRSWARAAVSSTFHPNPRTAEVCPPLAVKLGPCGSWLWLALCCGHRGPRRQAHLRHCREERSE